MQSSTAYFSITYQTSINLLALYHEYRSLIGYATHYLFCGRSWVAWQCIEVKNDHCSKFSNLRSLKKIKASTGFEPVTSAIPVRCSTNWAMKPTSTKKKLCGNFLTPLFMLKSIKISLPLTNKLWVYLGVRTCEGFLCFVAIVGVRVYYVDFYVFFVLRHWWVSQVLTARQSPNCEEHY